MACCEDKESGDVLVLVLASIVEKVAKRVISESNSWFDNDCVGAITLLV